MIRGVIFDFRDTLLQVDRSLSAANRALFQVVQKHRKMSRREFDGAMAKAVADIIRRYNGNTEIHDLTLHIIKRLLFLKNTLTSLPELERLSKIHARAFADSARLYPDARQVLAKLKREKIKMAVVIDGTAYREQRILSRLGLKKYFASVVISEKIDKNKFTPLPLTQAIKELKLKPAEIMVIGDRIDKDIINANRLGCVSVKLERKAGRFAARRAKSKLERPVRAIQNLKQILPLINGTA